MLDKLNTRYVTCICLQATSLYPLCSNLFIISPTSPLWTPSGFTIMKERSLLAAISVEKEEKIASKVATMWVHYVKGSSRRHRFVTWLVKLVHAYEKNQLINVRPYIEIFVDISTGALPLYLHFLIYLFSHTSV